MAFAIPLLASVAPWIAESISNLFTPEEEDYYDENYADDDYDEDEDVWSWW